MTSRADRGFLAFNASVSAVAVAFLAWLLLLRTPAAPGAAGAPDLAFMPGVNAALNGASAVLLWAGWIAVRRGAPHVHKRLMVSAFAMSALFLVGYVAYHYAHGDTRYAGAGAARTAYLIILVSHIVLSLAVLPGCLTMFWLAFRRRFAAHRRVGRVVLPIWLYVSVTGVIVYGMLHRGWFVQ